MKLQRPTRKQVVETEVLQAKALNEKVRLINNANDEYEKLETVLRDKEKKLLENHNTLVSQLNGEISTKLRQIETLFQPLEEKERKLLALEGYLDDKEVKMKLAERELEAKQSAIDIQYRNVRDKEAHVQKRFDELSTVEIELQGAISNIRHMETTAKDLLEQRQAHLDKKEAEIELARHDVLKLIAQQELKEQSINTKLELLEKERAAINRLKARYER